MLEARIDHSRVVSILRKADHLPLVKDYLIAVQKANLAAVNDAVNELLIEEEDFKVCPCNHQALNTGFSVQLVMHGFAFVSRLCFCSYDDRCHVS